MSNAHVLMYLGSLLKNDEHKINLESFVASGTINN